MSQTRSVKARTAALAAAGTLLGLLLAGCSGGSGDKAAPEALAPSDFRRAPTAETSAPIAPPESTAAATPPPPPTRSFKPVSMIAISEAAEGVLDVSTIPGPPPMGETPPAASGSGIVLDAKVGEINGHPIFASQFFEPIDGRLRAAAKAAAGRPDLWQREASKVIVQALRREITDELLLAEAYATMTPEVKEAGLRRFMRDIRDDMVRRNEGSAELADARLREREGLSIDEKTRETMERALVTEVLRKNAYTRINVSARDQQEYYDRYYEEFNPPGKARLRLIKVSASDSAGIESVGAALAAGDFEAAARLDANTFNRAGGGLHTVTVEGHQEEGEYFNIPELNDAARTMGAGEVRGPLAIEQSVYWLKLDSVDRPKGTDFYDAQLEINSRLLGQRRFNEELRYMDKLMRQGSFSNIDQTTMRLLEIATDRYFGRIQ